MFGIISSETDDLPDGKFLLVSANRHPESDHEYFDTEVYEFAVSDGALRALTNRKGPDNNATPSPNGKWIAYTGFDDRYQGHQTTKLYLMNRDGSGAHSALFFYPALQQQMAGFLTPNGQVLQTCSGPCDPM